jgi:hypothetical protein
MDCVIEKHKLYQSLTIFKFKNHIYEKKVD